MWVASVNYNHVAVESGTIKCIHQRVCTSSGNLWGGLILTDSSSSLFYLGLHLATVVKLVVSECHFVTRVGELLDL